MNDHLFRNQLGDLLPNSFRWFVGQNLMSFTPWYFCRQLDEFEFATSRFAMEDLQGRSVLTLIRRQDQDDFAGFEIKNNAIQENIIYFHPTFNGGGKWNITRGEYKDLFEFIRTVVLTDMQEWTMTDDFEEYKDEFREKH